MSRKTEVKLRTIAIIVAIISGGLTLVAGVAPIDLGLSPVQARWITVALGALTIASNFLPPVVPYLKGQGNAERNPQEL